MSSAGGRWCTIINRLNRWGKTCLRTISTCYRNRPPALQHEHWLTIRTQKMVASGSSELTESKDSMPAKRRSRKPDCRDGRKSEVVPIRMERGQTLFPSGQLIHSSEPNTSLTRSRRTFIGYYVDSMTEQLAKFYHPVLDMEGNMISEWYPRGSKQWTLLIVQEKVKVSVLRRNNFVGYFLTLTTGNYIESSKYFYQIETGDYTETR